MGWPEAAIHTHRLWLGIPRSPQRSQACAGPPRTGREMDTAHRQNQV